MEHALMQLDVLSCIIEQLEDSDDTLAHLARTSRSFSSLALDKLWHTTNIVLLARCMPPKYWSEYEIYATSQRRYYSKVILSAEDRSDDWLGPRFRSYAARIRSLNISHRVVDREQYPIQSSDWIPSISMRSIRECTIGSRDQSWGNESVTSSVSLDVLHAWCNCSGDSAALLFPNLSDLFWRGYQTQLIGLLDLFLGAPLVSLTVNVTSLNSSDKLEDAPPQAAIAIIHHALSSCPSFRSLDLQGSEIDIATFDALMELPLQTLQVFRCTEKLPVKLVQQLVGLPHLQVLEISLLEPASREPWTLSSAMFSALEELDISYITPSCAVLVVSAVRSTRLRHLALCNDHFTSTIDVQLILQSVADCVFASSLRYISVRYNLTRSHGVRLSPPFTTSMEVSPIRIDPGCLFSLRQLQYVYLDGMYCKIAATLLSMLEAWPDLKSLHVDSTSDKSPIALEVFYNMVSNRPSLMSLGGIRLQCMLGQDLPIPPHSKLPEVQCSTFYVPRLGDKTVERAPLVHYLTSHFPDLLSYGRSQIFGDDRACGIVSAVVEARYCSCYLDDEIWTLDDYREFEKAIWDQSPTDPDEDSGSGNE